MKKVLLIGSGGREYALAKKMAASEMVEIVYRAPGNGGEIDKTVCIDISAKDINGLKIFAELKGIDLVVVGPEDPLVMGIVDAFEELSIDIIGPRKSAARLEGSKIFTRKILQEYDIPSPEFYVFDSTKDAEMFIRDSKYYPCVIKVDGLAAGKGAMVCKNHDDVVKALARIDSGEFGDPSDPFLIEDCLIGEETSYIVMVDLNGNVLPLASSQDHKAEFDGDKGRNTGGMGAYSPAPVLNDDVEISTLTRIVFPLIKAMKEKGTPFSGFLYVGLMVDKDGNPFVVEFNVRLGDPETQPLLARMKSDLIWLFFNLLNGNLDSVEIEWEDMVAVTVVMAENGYPGDYDKGNTIKGIPEAEATGAIVDLAGVKSEDGVVKTAGGRVLGVTGLGADHGFAIRKAYQAVREITWGSEYFRTDIGQKAINR